jgi:hypothetical protein
VKIGKRRLIPSKKGHVSLSSPAGQTWRMRLCNPAARILVGRGHGGTARRRRSNPERKEKEMQEMQMGDQSGP